MENRSCLFSRRALLKSVLAIAMALTNRAVVDGQSTAPNVFFTPLAGANFTGASDGAGLGARFSAPAATAVDSSGNVYVADAGNQTIRKIAPDGTTSTLAGLAGVPGSADGTGAAARFYNPQGITVDGSDNIWVADAGNFTIRRITPLGEVSTFAGAAGLNGTTNGKGAAARFGFRLDGGQTSLAADGAGNLFVADGDVRKVAPDGTVGTYLAEGTAVVSANIPSQLSASYSWLVGADAAGNVYSNQDVVGSLGVTVINPSSHPPEAESFSYGYLGGFAVAHDGHVFLSDLMHGAIFGVGGGIGYNSVYDEYPIQSSDSPTVLLGLPYGLGADNAGGVYFADQHVNAIRHVRSDATVVTLAGEVDAGLIDGPGNVARFGGLAGLAVDSSGNVYVADCYGQTIRRVATDGSVTTLAGAAFSGGSADGVGSAAQFNHPCAVALDGTGNVWVVDETSHTVRRVSPDGTVATIAGAAGQPGYVDGTGSAARFNVPKGVAVDGSGDVYVCDSLNQAIRKISTTGAVTTLVGPATPGANTSRADGPAASARLLNPQAIACDASGNLYVLEGPFNLTGSALRKITSDGTVSTLPTGSFSSDNYSDLQVAVDGAGNVYVASSVTLFELTTTDAVIPIVAVSGPTAPDDRNDLYRQNFAPGAMTVDAAGTIYVADGTGQIRRGIRLVPSGAGLSFSTEPSSQSIPAGGSVTLSVGASGTAPISYQWLHDGNLIPNATGTTLSINGAVAGNSGTYAVVAVNPTGALLSASATVSVSSSPRIVQESNRPGSNAVPGVTLAAGQSTDFSATAVGSPDPTFQWRKDDAAIAGAGAVTKVVTNSVPRFANALSLTSLGTRDSGNYTVVVTNAAGSVESDAFPLTIIPNVTSAPQETIAPLGATASFTVAATGSPSLSYQWKKGGQAITGATSATLTIASVNASDVGNYSVVVSDSAVAGSTVETPAVGLTTTSTAIAPVIQTQPVNLYTTPYPVPFYVFSVSATGSPNQFAYQWQRDGVDIPGATSSVLNFPAGASASDVGTYTVRVSNSAGSVTSTSVTLILMSGAGTISPDRYPTITTAPHDVTVAPGASASFTAGATGSASPTYQWQKNGVNIPGASLPTLNIPNVTSADAGTYTVVISTVSGGFNPAGSGGMDAASAKLTVASAATNPVASLAVSRGHDALFSAGDAPGSIQWQVSTDGGTTWKNLANGGVYGGATTSVLMVSDAGADLNGTSYRFVATSGGSVTTSAGGMLTVTASQLTLPVGIVEDVNGNLYVADAADNTIVRIAPAGALTVLAGTAGQTGTADGTGAAARFNQPSSLALLPNGNLAVADAGNNSIRLVSPGGVVTTLAGAAGTAGSVDGPVTAATFHGPRGVASDTGGGIFVADSGNQSVRRISADGMVTTVSQGSGDFQLPTGLALTPYGMLVVADSGANVLRVLDPVGGSVTTIAGTAGVAGSTDSYHVTSLFSNPVGVAVDDLGNLYVADEGNHTIRRIEFLGYGGYYTTEAQRWGNTTTLAGVAGMSGLEDGSLNGPVPALFDAPAGLCLDVTGKIYIADSGNAAIRQLDGYGEITTLALGQTGTANTGSSSASGGGSGSSGGGGSTGGSGSTGGTGSSGGTGGSGSSGGSTGGGSTSSGSSGGGAMGGPFVLAVSLLALAAWRRSRGTQTALPTEHEMIVSVGAETRTSIPAR
jgi:hypothetical protein